jgi:hypothetical protein
VVYRIDSQVHFAPVDVGQTIELAGKRPCIVTCGALTSGVVMIWEKEDCRYSDRFDTIVLASGSKSERYLSDLLADADIPHTVIGDAVAPGKLNDAIHGGFMAALEI